MIVTIATLNDLGLQIEDTTSNNEIIATIVRNNERKYFNACMSVGLSALFTETTKDDDRFKHLRESVVVNDIQTLGVDYGVNYYIYYHFLLEALKVQSQSGITVQKPENSIIVTPRPRLVEVWNEAMSAQDNCICAISQSDDYPEITRFYPMKKKSLYLR